VYAYGSGTYCLPVFLLLCSCSWTCPCRCPALAPSLAVVSHGPSLKLCSAWLLMQPLCYELDPLMHNGIFTASPKPAAQ